MTPPGKRILLINPWIYDFAAFDMWAKPLGLLLLGGELMRRGYQVRLVDCLDAPATRRRFGTGKFKKTDIPVPSTLYGIKRHFGRYGLSSQEVIGKLAQSPRPAAILVTSLMTYWYPGVVEAIRLARVVHPGVPIILGGIYAQICPEHAREVCGADVVFAGNDLAAATQLVAEVTGGGMETEHSEDSSIGPFPAWRLISQPSYLVTATSFGCPFSCPYCASKILNRTFWQRDVDVVLAEILLWHKISGCRDIAFYDDALLVNAPDHIIPILEGLVATGIDFRLHCPNGLHVSLFTEDLAALLFRAGLTTIRLGLETTSATSPAALGAKTSFEDFKRVIRMLRQTGFQSHNLGAYLLVGLPGQSAAEVEDSLLQVMETGARPYLAEYSPLPKTALWPQAVAAAKFDLAEEPLYHNNTLLPCSSPDLTHEFLSRMRKNVADQFHGR
ncbi:MAG: radical SAM protein [Deltaproteobacteria bacterium]|nr:radical SAM protein [Deltaproteobacteria bacterium]